MQTTIRHRDGSHDHRRRTANPAGPRSRRHSAAATVVADLTLAALGAALIVTFGRFGAWDVSVAILVLIAGVATATARMVQAFRRRVELGVVRQPLRPNLRPPPAGQR